MEYTEDCAYLFSCNMPHYDLNADQWKTIDGQMKKMITKDWTPLISFCIC